MLFCRHRYNEWNSSQNFTSISAITNYTIDSSVKVKISDCQTRFTMSSGFFALVTPARHAVQVENRSGLTHFPAE